MNSEQSLFLGKSMRLPCTKSSLYMKKLTPEIEYQGETYLFLAQQLSAIPEEVLRDRIGSLEQHRDLLIDAIDFAITGI